jgi:hypothetical protein
MRNPSLGLNGRPPYRYEAEKNQAPIDAKREASLRERKLASKTNALSASAN